MQPLISIIVPVYNVEKYLNRCVESIVNQTYKNLEIILVDDASPDNCPALCDEWAERDSRIKTFHIENKGVANARNFALAKASGEYIAFADSDDYAEPQQLEVLYNNLAMVGADISVCGRQINDEGDINSSSARLVDKQYALSCLAMGNNYGVLWNKLYRKSLLDGIEMPMLVCCEDLVFNFYAFSKADVIVECDDKLYHYMQNQDSTVHRGFCIGAFDAVKSKELMLKELKGTELEAYAVRGLISSCFVVLSGVIQSGNCLDKYDELRSTILSYKRTIFKSPLYSRRDRIKTVILCLSRRLYNAFIKRSNQ